MIFHTLTLLSFAFSFLTFAKAVDPYLQVKELKLKNGILVYSAQNDSAKTFKMHVRVRTGFRAEDQSTVGISHLLEHYLFTDSKLNSQNTYLEEIKEHDGSANGSTSTIYTRFYATVPHHHHHWLVESFSKMMLDRKFTDEQVEHVKKPVFVEIGEIDPEDYLFLAISSFLPEVKHGGDFWDTEFYIPGLSHRVNEKTNTKKFRGKDLENWYRDYYHPENMVIFLSGHFDEKYALTYLEKTFGGIQTPSTAKTIPHFKPHPRKHPYVRTSMSSLNPQIEIGTKFWDLTAEDYVVLDMYLDHLSHRLMKEIRNVRAAAYTINPRMQHIDNFGYGTIHLDSLRSQFKENLLRVKTLIENEARRSHYSLEQFEEAKKLYQSQFLLIDPDSETLENLSESFELTRRTLQSERTSFKIYQDLTHEDFVRRLKNIFSEEREYYQVSTPVIFFKFELPLFCFLTIAALIYIARSLKNKSFKHHKINYVRKFRLLPVYLYEGFMILIATITATVIDFLVITPLFNSNFIQRIPLLSTYLKTFIQITVFFFLMLACLAITMKKLMIIGERVYIKSATFTSLVLPLGNITQVEVLYLHQVLFSWKRIKAIRWRFFYHHLWFWLPGLMITCKNGKSYYLSVKSPKKTGGELKYKIHEKRRSLIS